MQIENNRKVELKVKFLRWFKDRDVRLNGKTFKQFIHRYRDADFYVAPLWYASYRRGKFGQALMRLEVALCYERGESPDFRVLRELYGSLS